MYTLSCTAIGLRPIDECTDIYLNLQHDLNVRGLELAVGCLVNIEEVFDENLSIYLHDKSLYKLDKGIKRRLDFLNPDTHDDIAYFVSRNKVKAISYHGQPKDYMSLKEFDAAIKLLSFNIDRPVWVETMINSNYHYGDFNSIGEHDLLIDISHINLWAKGNHTVTEEMVLSLLNIYGSRVKQIHLSHNNGRSDSHELIPTDIWFKKYLESWSSKYVVTYESLPIEYAEYERLDKKSLKDRLNARRTVTTNNPNPRRQHEYNRYKFETE
jgi:hypothetical protein